MHPLVMTSFMLSLINFVLWTKQQINASQGSAHGKLANRGHMCTHCGMK